MLQEKPLVYGNKLIQPGCEKRFGGVRQGVSVADGKGGGETKTKIRKVPGVLGKKAMGLG